jgi:hypothetical protein
VGERPDGGATAADGPVAGAVAGVDVEPEAAAADDDVVLVKSGEDAGGEVLGGHGG